MNGIDAIKNWWDHATSRDQLFLIVGGVSIVVYLLFVAVLQPMVDARDKQVKRNIATAESLDRVRTLANQWMNRGKTGSKSKSSIVEIVDKSLREKNIRLSNMQPSGSRDVRLRIEQASFDNLLEWLHEMEIVHGLQIKDLSVAEGSDSGAVSVNVRLHMN